MAEGRTGPAGEAAAPPRAAVVTCSYFPEDMRVRREAEALVASGFRVDLLCLQRPSEKPRETVLAIDVHRLPLARKRGGKLRYFLQYALFFLLVFCRLLRLRLKNRYALVHVHNMPDAMIFAALVPRLTGAKLLLDISDPMPEVFMTKFGLPAGHPFIRILRLQERWSARFAHRVVTPNLAFRNVLVERSCPAEKIDIVMNTPPANIFADPKNRHPRAGAPAPGFTVMYHGTIVERHGLHVALDALVLVRDRIAGLNLQVYGEGESLEPFLKRVHELGLEGIVTYHGFVPIETIVGEIGKCSVGIIPNIRSPFTDINLPTRIFEFLELGKPVVAPRTRGILDYFDEEALFYFEAGDAQSLADSLVRVHEDPATVAASVAKGGAVCREHCWEGEARTLVAGVSSLLRPRSGATGRA